jgi:hypothetical protein
MTLDSTRRLTTGAETDIERAETLLGDMYASGTLSEASTNALLRAKRAPREIGAGLGGNVRARDLLLATLLVDDSPSISTNLHEIRRGHELMLRALARQTSGSDVLVLTKMFNRGVVAPYTPIDRATPLTEHNYCSARLLPSTPLYRQSLLTLATTLAKTHDQAQENASVRTFTLILTDGEDFPDPQDHESGTVSASDVRAIVTDMLEFSTNHIVAGMGVGERVDFQRIFLSMGIPSSWILTPGSTDKDLDAMFRRVSKALELAASSSSGFRQLSAGPPNC